jgi:hypothetical protein
MCTFVYCPSGYSEGIFKSDNEWNELAEYGNGYTFLQADMNPFLYRFEEWRSEIAEDSDFLLEKTSFPTEMMVKPAKQ